jgi:hypothetical protein
VETDKEMRNDFSPIYGQGQVNENGARQILTFLGKQGFSSAIFVNLRFDTEYPS